MQDQCLRFFRLEELAMKIRVLKCYLPAGLFCLTLVVTCLLGLPQNFCRPVVFRNTKMIIYFINILPIIYLLN